MCAELLVDVYDLWLHGLPNLELVEPAGQWGHDQAHIGDVHDTDNVGCSEAKSPVLSRERIERGAVADGYPATVTTEAVGAEIARWECGAKGKKVRIARGPLWGKDSKGAIVGKASGEKPSRRVGVLMWEAEDGQQLIV